MIDWAVAQRPLSSETVSGDGYVVEPFPNGVLVGVIDALGHGEEAHATAEIAAAILRAHAREDVASLMTRCHQRLRSGRGAVLSLASFSGVPSTMTWVGVGNVEGYLARDDAASLPRREALLLRNGVIGFQLPSMRATTLTVRPGDTLFLASDGIARTFVEDIASGPPNQIADQILARHGRMTDDALILVARYRGVE